MNYYNSSLVPVTRGPGGVQMPDGQRRGGPLGANLLFRCGCFRTLTETSQGLNLSLGLPGLEKCYLVSRKPEVTCSFKKPGLSLFI